MKVGQSGIVGSGNTAALLNAVAGTQYQIWDVSMSVAAGTDGTPAATSTSVASIILSEHSSGLVLFRMRVRWGGTVGSANPTLAHGFDGFIVGVGDGLDVTVSSVTAGFLCDAVANITYTLL